MPGGTDSLFEIPFSYADYVQAYRTNPDAARTNFRHDTLSFMENPYVKNRLADEENMRALERDALREQTRGMGWQNDILRQKATNPLYGRTDIGAQLQGEGIMPTKMGEPTKEAMTISDGSGYPSEWGTPAHAAMTKRVPIRRAVPNPDYQDAVDRAAFAERGTSPELEQFGIESANYREAAGASMLNPDATPPQPPVLKKSNSGQGEVPAPQPQHGEQRGGMTHEELIQMLMTKQKLTRGQAEAKLAKLAK